MEGTIAEIRGFASNFAPRAWAFCEGQLLAISQNQALFSLLGTIYGGDGRTTFALPDLRGRAPLQQGTGPGLSSRRLGERGGGEYVTLSVLQIPAHNHSIDSQTPVPIVGSGAIMVSDDDGDTNVATGNYLGATTNITGTKGPEVQPYTSTGPSGKTMGNNSVEFAGTVSLANARTANTGSSQSHPNMQPYLVINWIICMQGVFPSRG